jgi:hypothetical protein
MSGTFDGASHRGAVDPKAAIKRRLLPFAEDGRLDANEVSTIIEVDVDGEEVDPQDE